MTDDQEDNVNLGKIVFDDNNQERKSWACLGRTCYRPMIVFLSQLFAFFLLYWDAFGKFLFQKRVTIQLFAYEFYVVQQDTIYLHQVYEKVSFYKNCTFISLVGPSETAKPQTINKWLNIGIFQLRFDKIYFFHQQFQPLSDVMQRELESLEFAQGVKFEFFDSLKNNGTKYFLILDNSCDEICNPKEFVDVAIAGKCRGLSTTYIKHKLFHQSKIGEMLSSKKSTLLPSIFPVMRYKSVGPVHKWAWVRASWLV